ncbi:hypothetical protein N2152v2_001244 [Parachlorella kessleri]
MEGTPRSASVSFAELSSGAIDSGTSKLSKANFWKEKAHKLGAIILQQEAENRRLQRKLAEVQGAPPGAGISRAASERLTSPRVAESSQGAAHQARVQQLKQQLEGQLASARAGLQAQQAARLPAVDEDAEAHKHGLQEAAGAARLGVLSLQAANRGLLQSLERIAQQQAEASGSSPLAQKSEMLQQPQHPLPSSPPVQQQQSIEAGQRECSLSPCASLATPESRGMELRAGTPDGGHESPGSLYSYGEAHDLPALHTVLAAREGEVRVLREDSRVKQEELLRALAEIQASAGRQAGLESGGASHLACADLQRQVESLRAQLELTTEALEGKDAELDLLRCELEEQEGGLQRLLAACEAQAAVAADALARGSQEALVSAEEAEQLQEVLQEGEGSMPVEELAGRLEAAGLEHVAACQAPAPDGPQSQADASQQDASAGVGYAWLLLLAAERARHAALVERLRMRVSSLHTQRLVAVQQLRALQQELAEIESLVAPWGPGDLSNSPSPNPTGVSLSVGAAVSKLLQGHQGVGQLGSQGACCPADSPSQLVLRIQRLIALLQDLQGPQLAATSNKLLSSPGKAAKTSRLEMEAAADAGVEGWLLGVPSPEEVEASASSLHLPYDPVYDIGSPGARSVASTCAAVAPTGIPMLTPLKPSTVLDLPGSPFSSAVSSLGSASPSSGTNQPGGHWRVGQRLEFGSRPGSGSSTRQQAGSSIASGMEALLLPGNGRQHGSHEGAGTAPPAVLYSVRLPSPQAHTPAHSLRAHPLSPMPSCSSLASSCFAAAGEAGLRGGAEQEGTPGFSFSPVPLVRLGTGACDGEWPSSCDRAEEGVTACAVGTSSGRATGSGLLPARMLAPLALAGTAVLALLRQQ